MNKIIDKYQMPTDKSTPYYDDELSKKFYENEENQFWLDAKSAA